MSDEVAITRDEQRMIFTEQGLARSIRQALEANEGGDEQENADRAASIANVIFLGAILEVRGLVGAAGIRPKALDNVVFLRERGPTPPPKPSA